MYVYIHIHIHMCMCIYIHMGQHILAIRTPGIVWPGCFFFVVAPFCSCPASLVSRNFFAVGPGCAKCFFFVALRWAPRPFGGARAKKNTTQGVLFFAAAPGKGKGRRSPVGSRHGARAKKKHHPGCFFFFCCGPGERQGKEKPRWKPARGQSKKKNTNQGVFFLLRPPGKGRGRRSPVGRRHGARAKSLFFFLLWPRAGAQRGFSFPCLSPGQEQKKKHPRWCFFFALAPCRLPTGLLLPLPFAGAAAKKKTPWVVLFFLLWPRAGFQRGFSFPCLSPGPQPKKKTPWVVFFFCCGPARTLTHSLRAWVAMPPPRRDAHSLTVGWGDFGKARVVFFFLLRPRRVFLDNSKKCLGYYIGSKKTRRGHSKKKNTTSVWPVV